MEDFIISKHNRRKRKEAERRRMRVDGASVRDIQRIQRERAEGKKPLNMPAKKRRKGKIQDK